jgi:hypothetical protein
MNFFKKLHRKLFPTSYYACQAVLRSSLNDHYARYGQVNPLSPSVFGMKFFSQGDEDGITLEIVDRLDINEGTFIEIGCGDGLENNTAVLVLKNFKGCWHDGNSKNYLKFIKNMGQSEWKDKLIFNNDWISKENVAAVLEEDKKFLSSDTVDIVSIDVDSTDVGIAEACALHVKPKLIIVEYNASIPFSTKQSIKWNCKEWSFDDYQSGSLRAIAETLTNYILVGCSSSGTNAFFVLREAINNKFCEYPLKTLFIPPQYYYNDLDVGHKRTYKWLKHALNNIDLN